jgi:RecG-like helicase
VGLKDLKRRLTASVEELDAVRLHDRYSGLGITEIGAMEARTPVRVGGEVQRLRVVPRSGSPSIEAVLSDGTGEVMVVFTGRRSIGGLHPGRGVLVEGVAHAERGRLVITNPAYTLLES